MMPFAFCHVQVPDVGGLSKMAIPSHCPELVVGIVVTCPKACKERKISEKNTENFSIFI
jgi:hypothetical protein